MSSQRPASAARLSSVPDAIDCLRSVNQFSPSQLQARAKALGLEPLARVIEPKHRASVAIEQQGAVAQGRVLTDEQKRFLSVFDRLDIVSAPFLSSLEELDYPGEARVRTVLHNLFRAGLIVSVPGKGHRRRAR